MKTIKNKNGHIYFVIGNDGEYTLLKGYEGAWENSCHYVVAWKLHEVGNGLHEWEQGHYFSDIGSACSCFDRKIMPFDPPYMVLA